MNDANAPTPADRIGELVVGLMRGEPLPPIASDETASIMKTMKVLLNREASPAQCDAWRTQLALHVLRALNARLRLEVLFAKAPPSSRQ